MKTRKIRYRGESREQSLVIGNHADVDFRASGNFDLSGLIYCPRYTLTISLSGTGTVSFRGTCKQIIVERINGDCVLDISDLSCREFQCRSALGKARIHVGKTRLISQANLMEHSTLKYTGQPFISGHSVQGPGKMERVQKKIKKAA